MGCPDPRADRCADRVDLPLTNFVYGGISRYMNTMTATETVTRRIETLVALGEDIRNTVAWRDALAEHRQLATYRALNGRK